MKQRLLLFSYVLSMGVITLFAHDSWGLLGALAVVAVAIGAHVLMLRRQRGIEGRMRQILEGMSDQEIQEQVLAMPEEDRAEVTRILVSMGRTVPF